MTIKAAEPASRFSTSRRIFDSGPFRNEAERRNINLVLSEFPPNLGAMPHHPHEAFDHTVLDMIERSPIGAVPNTPDHQDALIRLHAAHQVYADADHKDGHVTARSLAKSPNYHAGNLEAFIAGEIEADKLESNLSIFDRYVQSLPPARRAAAESHRTTVAGRPIRHRAKHVGDAREAIHDPLHTLFLVPGSGRHPGLPGNYLYGSVFQGGAHTSTAPWTVQLHDSFGGGVACDAATLPLALAKVQEVLASAPFAMDELADLGFK